MASMTIYADEKELARPNLDTQKTTLVTRAAINVFRGRKEKEKCVLGIHGAYV
jgi:hypothetical protein